MADIITLGELLVDMFPAGKGTSFKNIDGFVPTPGGAPANVAVGVARFGVTSAFIGKVGNDAFGHFLRETLLRNKVEVSQLHLDKKVKTTLAFIMPKRAGEVGFLFYRNPGADMMLTPDEIKPDFIKKGKIFHFGSISMIDEPSCSATLKAIKYAKQFGLLISFDPNLRLSLWKSKERAKRVMIEGLKKADIVKLNDKELEFITGVKDIKDGTDKILKYRPKLVLVTRGQKATFFNNGKTQGGVDAFKVKVVDPVGCGDAFVAGALVKLLSVLKRKEKLLDFNWHDLVDLVIFANAAGALTAMKRGVIPALPAKTKVEELLESVQK